MSTELPSTLKALFERMWRDLFDKVRGMTVEEIVHQTGGVISGGRILPSALPYGTDVQQIGTTNDPGDSVQAARVDHVHKHPDGGMWNIDAHHPMVHSHDGVDGSGDIQHHYLEGLLDDDHTQYQLRSEQGAAGGYPELDGSTLVPTDQLGTGAASSSTFLRGDRTWQEVAGGPGGASYLDDLEDVDATSPSDGDVLTYDGDTGLWTSAPPLSGTMYLDDIEDVYLDVPSDGDVLTYDGDTGLWTSVAPSSGSDSYAFHDNQSNEIYALGEKVTPVDEDVVLIEDSADSWSKKKVKFSKFGGGGSSYTHWEPDHPPASPSAYDDEFDDSSLSADWTEWDHDNNVVVTEDDEGLVLSHSSVGADRYAGVQRSLPAGDFTITIKMAYLGIHANYAGAGLILFETPSDSSKRFYLFGHTLSSGDHSVSLQFWNSYASWGSTMASHGDVLSDTIFYLRFRRTGTTYACDYSFDGLGWIRVWSGSLSFTPSAIGMGIDNNGTGESNKAIISFFRYKNSDIGLTGILEGQRISF